MSDFIRFASSYGLVIDRLSIGKITRCATQSHKHKRNGAFFFDGDWGWVQNWEESDGVTLWKSDKVIDNAEFRARVKASQEKHSAERSILSADAAKKAKWILGQCKQNISAYLGRKGFPEMCANVWEKDGQALLVVPMRKDGLIVGCQLIDSDGSKKFLKGQITQDAYFRIGSGSNNFFVEGYASGLSLQAVLSALKINDYSIYVTFSASNLCRLAKRTGGIVIADNDTSKTGEKYAIESGCVWWMPPIAGMDINDYTLKCGQMKAAFEIRKLIYKKVAA